MNRLNKRIRTLHWERERERRAKCKLTSCWIRDVMVQKWLHKGRERRALYI
jgi:hypothetical protein